MENKQSRKKIPFWAWVLIVILCIGFLSTTFFGKSKEDIRQETIEKQANDTDKQIQEFHNKGEKLNNEVGDIFVNSDTITIFVKSHLENVGDTSINLELTVNDSWYYLPKFQQERLLKDTCKTFDTLTIKNGLRQENDMPWKVTFLDTYEKKVAQDNCW